MARIKLQNISVTYPTSERVKLSRDNNINALDVAGTLEYDKGGRLFVKALDSISLDLKDGDRLGIIGTNGSGKTTLLRTMAGIYTPQEGVVSVEGFVTTMFSIGMGMREDLSGLKNVFLSGTMLGASREQIETVLPDILDFTELGDYIHLPFRTYSQGMAMRLRFACATAFQPDIVLMDEWIGAGDAQFQAKAQTRLDALLENSGIIVLATHNQDLIKKLANQTLWLEKGRIMGLGETKAVLAERAVWLTEQGRLKQ